MADIELIKPRELPAITNAQPTDAVMLDNGVTVGKVTPEQLVNAGAAVASEAEALAGVNNTKRMTPLRVRQVLDNVNNPAVLRAQAWAESDTPPDPLLPDSKSAKTWASIAEQGVVMVQWSMIAADGQTVLGDDITTGEPIRAFGGVAQISVNGFGPITPEEYSVDSDGVITLTAPLAEGDVVSGFTQPRLSNSEAQAVVQGVLQQTGTDVAAAQAEADRAEAASVAAQSRTDIVLTTAFGPTGATLDTLTYAMPGIVAGATVRAGDTNALYEVVALGSLDYDFSGDSGVLVKALRRADGWHLVDFTKSLSGDMGAAFERARIRASGDKLITPQNTTLNFTAAIKLDTAQSTYEFGSTKFSFEITGTQNAVEFNPKEGGGRSSKAQVFGGTFERPVSEVGTPAYVSHPNTTGFYLHSALNHPNAFTEVIFTGVTVRGFGSARKLGNNSYIFGWQNSSFSANGRSLWAPPGLTNSGENISDWMCVHANGNRGVVLESQVNFRAYACSFDYNTGADFVTVLGNIFLHGGHWEWRNSLVTESKIITGTSVTKAVTVALDDVTQIVSAPGDWPDGLAPISGENAVLFSRCRLYGMLADPNIPWNADGGAVLMRDMFLSANAQIRGDLGPGSWATFNADLALDAVPNMGFVLTGTGVGARVSATEFAGAKISRTPYSPAPQTTGYALRVEKQFGDGASMGLAFYSPKVRSGEVQCITFDVIDPDGCFAAETTLFLTRVAVEVKGYDADGVPITGREQSMGAIDLPAPSAAWQHNITSLFQYPNFVTPAWATHMRWSLGLTQMAGAATGAAEDGGRKSIYLSPFRVSSWGMAR